MKAQKGNRVIGLLFLDISALDGVGWSTPRSGRFTPGKEAVYPLYRMLCGPSDPVRTGAENVAFTGIRSTDCSACSESLSRSLYVQCTVYKFFIYLPHTQFEVPQDFTCTGPPGTQILRNYGCVCS